MLVRHKSHPKTIWFVPKSVGKIIGNRLNDQLRIVQSGCRCFIRHNSNKIQHKCHWRLSQDGCQFIVKFMTKRIIEIPLNLFLIITFEGTINFEYLNKFDNGIYKEFNKKMSDISGGCVILKIKSNECPNNINEKYNCVCCWKSKNRIDLMINKNDIQLICTHLLRIFTKLIQQLKNKYHDINFDNYLQVQKQQRDKNKILSESGNCKNKKSKQTKKKQ